MKRALVLSLVAVLALSMTAFGFFGFGYTHDLPTNTNLMFVGFTFGPDASAFTIDLIATDVWTIVEKPAAGVRMEYTNEGDNYELGVGGLCTVKYASPSIKLKNFGLFGDFVFHVLPPVEGGATWDLFATFDVDMANGGALELLRGTVGFEVEL